MPVPTLRLPRVPDGSVLGRDRRRWPGAPLTAIDLKEDRRWLLVMAGATAIETGWWAIAFAADVAPLPRFGTYLGLSALALGAAMLTRRAIGYDATAVQWPAALAALLLVALGASVFLPIKYAIPSVVPFWLDRPVALAERSIFGADPWLILDSLLGWAAQPMDWIYGTWLPVQSVVLFMLILARPSPAKTRALIGYVLSWFLLGVVVATLLSSAGPVFYDRLLGGQDFAALNDNLRRRGAWVAIAESDRMWAALADGRPGMVAGISAIPSIHVAVSLWFYLSARSLAPRAAPAAMAYFVLIWIGSVQLGWHYAVDGLAGAAGMLAIWWLTGRLAPRPDKKRAAVSSDPLSLPSRE